MSSIATAELVADFASLFSSNVRNYSGSVVAAKHQPAVVSYLDTTKNLPNYEAQRLLSKAQQLKHDVTKQPQCQKLFRQALKLDPHPNICVAYGEFLESDEQNLTAVRQLFALALAICPEHGPAKSGLQRTTEHLQGHDVRTFSRIERERDQLSKWPDSVNGLCMLKDEMQYRYIYHTLAIEGSTLDRTQIKSIINAGSSACNDCPLEHREVLGMKGALDYILDDRGPKSCECITLDHVLQMHRHVLGAVDSQEAGRLRKIQVYVGSHVPPAADGLQICMEKLVQWMNSSEAKKLNPIEQAAKVHHELAAIHPFIDGNGRTARLLMNLVLLRAGYPLVVVNVRDRSTYLHILESVDRSGCIEPFVYFVTACVEQTIDDYVKATEGGPGALQELLNHDDSASRRVVAGQ